MEDSQNQNNKKKFKNDWQKYLDELENNYYTDDYFNLNKDKKNFNEEIKDSYYSPELTEVEKQVKNEGQLALDVFQTENSLIIKSAIAGVKPDDVEISICDDVLTIEGERKLGEEVLAKDYFHQECYWGKFSRSVVLPVEVNEKKVQAIFKNGILTITLPKVKKAKAIKVKIKEEI